MEKYMQVTIRNVEEEYGDSDFVTDCPECKKTAEVWYDDYVTQPMILCWSCGGKFILDIPMEIFYGKKFKTVTTNLLFIEAVSRGKKDIIEKTDNEDRYDENNFPKEEVTFHPVNSYNLNKPQVKYPKDFELEHDGVYLFIKAKGNGNFYNVTLWGD